MNKHKSLKSAQSLLERASDLYGFDSAIRGKVVPVAEPKKAPDSSAALKEKSADERLSDNIVRKDNSVAKTSNSYELNASLNKPRAIKETPKIIQTANVSDNIVKPDIQKTTQYSNAIRKIDRQWLSDTNLLVPDGPVTALSEEYRIVKRQLLLAARGGKGVAKVENGERILICSANPNEGKTYTSVNLALSLASEKDNRVLLVDADFPKPSVLSTIGVEGGLGLMDALADPSLDVNQLVLPTDVDGLSILPAGSQSNQDTEYLAAVRTSKIIEKLSQDDPNRIIIFDSPPALAASPASVLALHVGQILMVVHADKTSDSALRDALNLLSGCDHVQLLLNRATFSPSGRKFGTYYGYGA